MSGVIEPFFFSSEKEVTDVVDKAYKNHFENQTNVLLLNKYYGLKGKEEEAHNLVIDVLSYDESLILATTAGMGVYIGVQKRC